MNCNEDAKVIETNTEASISKLSCVAAGYYEDKYIRSMVKSVTRRNPIINLGYAIRVDVFRNLVRSFVSVYQNSQIISLGAGSDTLGFWILEHFQNLHVFELDYASVVVNKSKMMESHSSIFQNISNLSDRLHLIPCDLRSSTDNLPESLKRSGFDPSKPCLFLAECVLIYLDRFVNDSITTFIASSVTDSSTPVYFASYDQVNPNDAFGRIMMNNLDARGCSLRSIENDTVSQASRLSRLGFSRVRVEHMSHFTTRCAAKRPEIIDEVEELNLLQDHYMFSLASSRAKDTDCDLVTRTVFFEQCS